MTPVLYLRADDGGVDVDVWEATDDSPAMITLDVMEDRDGSETLVRFTDPAQLRQLAAALVRAADMLPAPPRVVATDCTVSGSGGRRMKPDGAQGPSDPYRAASGERVEYVVVSGAYSDDLTKKLTEHAARGFRVVPGGSASGGEARSAYYLMERVTT